MALAQKDDRVRGASNVNAMPENGGREKARATPRLAAIDGNIERAEATGPETGSRKADMAFDLLEQASTVLPALMTRCQQLEAELSATREKGHADLQASNGVARQWQTIAQEMKTQIERLQKDLSATKQRAEMAEADVEAIRLEAERTHQQKADAEALSSLFHDKVVSSLGNGTRAYSVLQAMMMRTAVPAAA